MIKTRLIGHVRTERPRWRRGKKTLQTVITFVYSGSARHIPARSRFVAVDSVDSGEDIGAIVASMHAVEEPFERQIHAIAIARKPVYLTDKEFTFGKRRLNADWKQPPKGKRSKVRKYVRSGPMAYVGNATCTFEESAGWESLPHGRRRKAIRYDD